MQKEEKIWPSRSSLLTAPVMLPSASWARRRSSAMSVAVLAGVQLGEGVLVVAFGLVQGAQVAFARDVRAFFAAITADSAGDGIAQGVNAGAGFG